MKLKGVLSALAPTLVKTVVGSSPIGSLAMGLVTKKLGLPETSTVQEVEQHVEQHPEKAELLNSVELEIQRMQSNIESQKLQNEEMANARSAHKDSLFPVIFGSAVLLGFFAYVFLITIKPPSQADLALSNLILGNLFAVVSGISGWLYGQQNGKK